MRANWIIPLKAAIVLACSAPMAWLVIRGFEVGGATLGANPVETVLLTTGKTGLNILLVSLAVTPLRILTGLNLLVRTRRMLGLFAFFYVALHFLTYAVLDLRLEWNTLFVDITERPYITVGMLALTCMIPLAVTSTKGMQRRLGRRWVTLHRAVYAIAILALVHFFWQVKLDIREPLVYAAILAVLLGFRIARAYRLRQRRLSYQSSL
jgi:sulfoxide reductase heme-binding subunit YedZ